MSAIVWANGARGRLEQAYGWQLDAVRVHDAPAERGMAHALHARAFASGSHIVHAGAGAFPAPGPADRRP